VLRVFEKVARTIGIPHFAISQSAVQARVPVKGGGSAVGGGGEAAF